MTAVEYDTSRRLHDYLWTPNSNTRTIFSPQVSPVHKPSLKRKFWHGSMKDVLNSTSIQPKKQCKLPSTTSLPFSMYSTNSFSKSSPCSSYSSSASITPTTTTFNTTFSASLPLVISPPSKLKVEKDLSPSLKVSKSNNELETKEPRILLPLEPTNNIQGIPLTFYLNTKTGLMVTKYQRIHITAKQRWKRLRIFINAIFAFRQAGLKTEAADLLGFFSKVHQNYMDDEIKESTNNL